MEGGSVSELRANYDEAVRLKNYNPNAEPLIDVEEAWRYLVGAIVRDERERVAKEAKK